MKEKLTREIMIARLREWADGTMSDDEVIDAALGAALASVQSAFRVAPIVNTTFTTIDVQKFLGNVQSELFRHKSYIEKGTRIGYSSSEEYKRQYYSLMELLSLQYSAVKEPVAFYSTYAHFQDMLDDLEKHYKNIAALITP